MRFRNDSASGSAVLTYGADGVTLRLERMYEFSLVWYAYVNGVDLCIYVQPQIALLRAQ